MQYKFTTEYYYPRLNGLQSSVQFKPGIEADYELSSWLRVLAYDDFTYREFSQYGSMTKDSVGLGLRNYWTPQLYLEGRAGEDFIQPIIGSNTTRPRYLVSLNDQRDQRTLYTLSYSKEYQDTPYSEFLFNNWQASLEVNKDLTARINFYASVFTGGGVYVAQGVKEHLNGAGAGVVFHVTKNTDFRAEYRFSDNTSNITADTYQKHTALLEISIKF
jgi:opacity protein-like surface antigen